MPSQSDDPIFTPSKTFDFELGACVNGTPQSQQIASIYSDIVRDKEEITINAKPLVELLVNPPEPLIDVQNLSNTNFNNVDLSLLVKVCDIMNRELGMALRFEEGKPTPEIIDALRIFTQRGFTHLANNTLAKVLTQANELPSSTKAKMDISKVTDNNRTTALKLTTTFKVFVTRNTNDFSTITSKDSSSLIDCTSEIVLPVRKGVLQRDSQNGIIYDSVKLSSESTHPKFKSVSDSLHLDAEYEVIEQPAISREEPYMGKALIEEISREYASLQQPNSFFGKIKAKFNASKMEALNNAIDCLHHPTHEKIEELKKTAIQMKSNPRVFNLIIEAIAYSESNLVHLSNLNRSSPGS